MVSRTLADSELEPSRDFTGIIPPSRNSSTEAPEIANFAQLMNRTYAGMWRAGPGVPGEITERESALDALSDSVDEANTPLQAVPERNLNRGNRNPRLQSEDSRPKPFPARLPSRRSASRNPRVPGPPPVHVGFANEEEVEEPGLDSTSWRLVVRERQLYYLRNPSDVCQAINSYWVSLWP